MALTRDFRVKDGLNVGLSALFAAGGTTYDGSKVAINSLGKILSGGRDLADIFADADLEDLTGGVGINSFKYDGLSPVNISLSGASGLSNDSLIRWSSASGFVNSSLTNTALTALQTSVASNSANWNTAYNQGTSVYSSYNAASAGIVKNVTAPATQGQFTVLSANGSTSTLTIHNLGTTGTPTFGNTTINGTLSVTGVTTLAGVLSVGGNTIIGNAAADTLTVNAGAASFPNATSDTNALILGTDVNLYRSEANVLKTDDSLIVNDNLTVNNSTTLGFSYHDTLTVNAGTINFPNVTDISQSLVLGSDVTLYRSASAVLRTEGSLDIGGNTTINGNLSVLGDFTRIDTLVSVTSALSVINAGTGPALYIAQSGIQPIAQFIDRDGGTITFSDTGSVGIGTALGAIPGEKLTVSGSISARDTLKLGTIASGTTNSVVIESSGTLQKRTINAGAFDTSAPFISGSSTRTVNTLPKFSSTTGITNSNITDDGTNVAINGNVVIGSAKEIEQASGSDCTSITRLFNTNTTAAVSLTASTFDKTGLKSVKYLVSLNTAGTNRTSFEVLAVYNDTAAFGSVYNIIDAQGTSLLTSVDVSNASTTIDLVITTSSDCVVMIYGTALYNIPV